MNMEISKERMLEMAQKLAKMDFCPEQKVFYKNVLEMVKADAEGRLVVLPCKVGDTIYYTKEGRTIVEPLKVRTFFVVEPARRGEILHLRMIRTDKFDVSMDAIGKTVFLTREEAEAALEKMGGGEK